MLNKRYYYVYLITNKINGKIYIGQRVSEKEPIIDNYFGSGNLLKRAINKYGKENFEKEIIVDVHNQEELNSAEVAFIEYCNSQNPEIGYNIASGGDYFTRGVRKSRESNEKRKKAMVGRKIIQNGLPLYIMMVKNVFLVTVKRVFVGNYKTLDLAIIARDRFIKDGYKIRMKDSANYGIYHNKNEKYFELNIILNKKRMFICRTKTIKDAIGMKIYMFYLFRWLWYQNFGY